MIFGVHDRFYSSAFPLHKCIRYWSDQPQGYSHWGIKNKFASSAKHEPSFSSPCCVRVTHHGKHLLQKPFLNIFLSYKHVMPNVSLHLVLSVRELNKRRNLYTWSSK